MTIVVDNACAGDVKRGMDVILNTPHVINARRKINPD
jgi:hypothetical protein